MKKNLIAVALCLIVFIILRLLPIFTQGKVETIQTSRLKVPALLTGEFPDVRAHPWIAQQTDVPRVVPEMARDVQSLKQLFTYMTDSLARQGKEPLSEEKMTNALIMTIARLQEEVPFSIPSHYYNVLCLPETPSSPYRYHIYKRIYLGETELGFPYYLDVRRFDVTDKTVEDIIAWHFDTLIEGQEAFQALGDAFIGQGTPRPDLGHGFAALQGERGVFVYPLRRGKYLYVAYSEAPWTDFDRHRELFEEVKVVRDIPLISTLDKAESSKRKSL